jgi:subtilase family serine protease
VANAQGYAAGNSGWAQEISLDVEWAHAVAPGAHILLVEAASSSYADLFGAVNYAANHNASVVSMSWGGSEFSWETSFDAAFSNPHVTFVASSGDKGSVVSYPAASPYVLGVGGTSLNVDSSGNYLGETAWSDSGGGTSAYESKPSYQKSVETGSRSTPDVSFNANPNTGVAVYDSFAGGGGWGQYGGTSAGAPQWAALIAIADQLRAADGKASLGGASQVLPTLYKLQSTGFHDVVSGNTAQVAGTGFSLVTGLGSPIVPKVVSALVNATLPAAVTPAASATKSSSGKSGTSPIALAAFSATATPQLVLYPPPAHTNPQVATVNTSSSAVVVSIPAKSSTPVSVTEESGGGENGVPADTDAISDPNLNDSQPASIPAAGDESFVVQVGPMNASSAGLFTAANWREDSAAYFADQEQTVSALPGLQAAVEDVASDPDAKLSVAGVVLMLGAFGGTLESTKKAAIERSRNINRRRKNKG